MKRFRWKAIVPMVLFVVLAVLAWALYADLAIRRGVEWVGTEVVGARVDLASARLRLLRGDIVLEGLQVTDPRAPMTNMVQVGTIVADLDMRALLELKAVVETLAVREVRFGTPRRTSGAIERTHEGTGLVARQLFAFADRIPTPSFDLSGLAELARFQGIHADSLQTPRAAQAVAARGDSLRLSFEADLRAADPTPVVDSARALSERLSGQTVSSLGVTGTARALQDVRGLLTELRGRKDRVAALRATVDAGVDSLRAGIAGLEATRQADYAYARRLVKVPSLAAPDLSAALFQRIALERLAPMLHWLAVAEKYVPPGLDPRNQPAPDRVRMAGTSYTFPKEQSYPTMLVSYAEASLALGGRSAATGAYRAVARGITTEPAVYGRPLTFSVQRTAAAVGPRAIRIDGVLDRVGRAPRDSIDAHLGGTTLPAMTLGPVGARLALGSSDVDIAFARRGEAISGRWHVRSDSVAWSRLRDSAATAPGGAAAASRVGTRAWADALLWRAVSGLRAVEIDARISGTLAAPHFDVSSNVGVAVSQSLQREVGAEVARAEARARAEVDRVVQAQISAARAKLAGLQSGVQSRLAGAQTQLDAVQADLEQRLEELSRSSPVRLPTSLPSSVPRSLPRLPRP